MTTNHRQHTTYMNLIKRAIARNSESQEYRKPGSLPEPVKTVEAKPVIITVEPVTLANEEPIKVEKPARARKVKAVKAAAEPEPVKVETVKSEPVKVEYWKPEPGEGIPAKGDTFQIVTLTSDVYNGKRIPFPSLVNGLGASIFPVYFVANQNGELMQTVTTNQPTTKPGEMVLGWHYRSEGLNGEAALETSINDIKRLKAWQRAHYGKHAEPASEIKLNARGTADNFEIERSALLAAVKGLGKKVYLNVAGYLFPAATLAAITRIEDEGIFTVKVENNERPNLVIQNGNSITRLLGMAGDHHPAGIEIIPCLI